MSKIKRIPNFVRHAIFTYGRAHPRAYLTLTTALAGYVCNTCGLFPARKRVVNIKFKDLSAEINALSGEISGYWENFQDDKYAARPTQAASYCVFDIGGNAGFFSMLQVILHKEKLRIFTFEPDPDVYGRTRRNIEQCNQGRNATLSVNNFAVGSSKGFAGFVRDGSCLSHVSTGAAGEAKHFDVPIDTLDNIVEANNVRRIDLMKIDVEGHEVEVLKGGLRTALPITKKIVLQYHPGRLKPVQEILEAAGFRLSGGNEAKETAFFQRPDNSGEAQSGRS